VSGLVVRQLAEDDLADADRINRIAFGTFFGLETPSAFRGDGEVIAGRFAANPDGAFAADIDGTLVACGFVMDWGSVGLLGPLTVDVDVWGRGIGRAMLDAMTRYMDSRNFVLQGLFTHPQSPTHIRLYEAYGFRMQRISAVMERAVDVAPAMPPTARFYSELTEKDRQAVLAECRRIADGTFAGLDLTREILSIEANGFGDTIVLGAEHALTGFACCHQGAGSEAGSAQTLVKFVAVDPGSDARAEFEKLMAACESFAALRGTKRLVAGTNTGRAACYEALLDLGFRSWMNGIAMLKPAVGAGVDGYNVPGVFAVDDWR
jgi:GNAT superfamily N-acetyltransferase